MVDAAIFKRIKTNSTRKRLFSRFNRTTWSDERLKRLAEGEIDCQHAELHLMESGQVVAFVFSNSKPGAINLVWWHAESFQPAFWADRYYNEVIAEYRLVEVPLVVCPSCRAVTRQNYANCGRCGNPFPWVKGSDHPL